MKTKLLLNEHMAFLKEKEKYSATDILIKKYYCQFAESVYRKVSDNIKKKSDAIHR